MASATETSRSLLTTDDAASEEIVIDRPGHRAYFPASHPQAGN